MNIDMMDILLGIASQIPWWVYPLLLFGLFISVKMKDMELEEKIRKEYKVYKKIHQEENENKKYEPRNIINTDMYKDMKEQSKKKGDEYEKHVSKHFEDLGYKTVEHGKMHGVKDKGIDLMLKKGKEFIFVQCKDWNIENKHRIDSKEIQYTRMNVRDYVENKKALFDMYDWKILYVTSDKILDKSAQHKIKEFSHEIEHQVIPMGVH